MSRCQFERSGCEKKYFYNITKPWDEIIEQNKTSQGIGKR